MTNKDKALHLVDQGFQVIPVGVNEDGSHNYNFKWSDIRITTPELVNTYWYGTVDRRVAVLHPTIGVIDVDIKNGKNGFEVLKNAGYELPDTYNYETKSGGRHYVVRFPAGSTKFVPVEGVDVQVANGIFVWYGDVLSNDELANIADAPAWAVKSEEVKKTVKADPIAWMNSLPQGDYANEVQRILAWDSLQYPNINHEGIIKGQYALLSEAAKGAIGVPQALMELKSRFLFGEYDTPEYEQEWNNGLKGLVFEKAEELDAIIEDNTDEAKREADIAKRVWDIENSRAAQRRVREKNYSGTVAWEWEALESIKMEYTVQDLLYKDSQNGLVGRSQLGKTHLLVSLMSHMALGLPWFNNIQVKQQRVLFIAGEGKGGIVQRFRDWTKAYGYTMDDIKPFIKIVTDVDLSLEVSLEQLQDVANAFQPDVIILDTLSATTSMENENDATDMAEALANGRAIYPDSIVLWVHHPSEATRFQKDPKPRGSSVFKSNLDNMMTITVDDSFQPVKDIEKYTNGNEVRFLTLSTDDETHGGKSKEGAPITIRGLYLWEFERGHVVMAQADGEDTHPDNVVIKKVFDAWSGKTISTKDFWAKADELKLKNSDDKEGGWTSQRSADRMLEKAETRGLVIGTRNKGQSTTWERFDASSWTGGF